jgi:acyl-CoA thioester hydrolase
MSVAPAERQGYYAALAVRFHETDAQGHVNFAQYFNYFDVALTGFLRAREYGYSRLLAEQLDLLYVDARAQYHAPAYFEEPLRIYCTVGRVGNTSITFEFQVVAERDQRRVAGGSITVVVAERESHRAVRVPDILRQALEAHEPT